MAISVNQSSQQSRIISDVKGKVADQIKSGKSGDVAKSIDSARKDFVDKGGTAAAFKETLVRSLNAQFTGAQDASTLDSGQKDALETALKTLDSDDLQGASATSGASGTSGSQGTTGASATNDSTPYAGA